MKIAIIGGSFNPAHVGHVAMADVCLSLGFIDEAWFVPSKNDFYDKNLVGFDHRTAMLRLATKHKRGVVVSEIEEDVKPSCTWDLMTSLRFHPKLGKNEFFFVVGMDNVAKMATWIKADRLIDENRFIILPRNEEVLPSKGLWALESKNYIVKRPVGGPPLIPTVSSFQIRNALAKGDMAYAQKYLQPEVLAYCLRYKLYPVGT